jgi:hypothetical protein
MRDEVVGRHEERCARALSVERAEAPPVLYSSGGAGPRPTSPGPRAAQILARMSFSPVTASRWFLPILRGTRARRKSPAGRGVVARVLHR